jgi:phosphatidylserine/phosphatidylglycerophosphate/cardiolipin synthase-like enzyme
MHPRQLSHIQRQLLPGTLLLLALLIGIHLLVSGALTTIPEPPTTRTAIRAYFTTPDLIYPDQPGMRPPSTLLNAIIADINAARQSVDLAVFDLDVPALIGALQRAAERGLTVRVVLDSENLTAAEVAHAVSELEDSGINVVFDQRSPFMHHKIVLIDRRIVWVGSWNATINDTFRNNNNQLRIESVALASAYSTEFEDMVTGNFGRSKQRLAYDQIRVGASRVAVRFSPNGAGQELILERLANARRSIQMLAFSFTSQEIAAALIAAQQRGVAVRGVANATQGSAGSAIQRVRSARIPLLDDGNCFILHHKVLIIDEQTVITGSYNFSKNAEQTNDENLIVLDDRQVARLYLAEFDRIWAKAEQPDRCR